MRLSLFATALLCSGLIAACGTSDEDKVEESLSSFVTAVQDKDKGAFCDAVTSAEIRKSDNCAKQVRAEDLEAIGEVKDAKAENIKVDGDKATATVSVTVRGERTSDNATFRKIDGDWKIDLDEG